MCDDLNEDFFWSFISVIPFPEFKKKIIVKISHKETSIQGLPHAAASRNEVVMLDKFDHLTSEAIFGRTNNV